MGMMISPAYADRFDFASDPSGSTNMQFAHNGFTDVNVAVTSSESSFLFQSDRSMGSLEDHVTVFNHPGFTTIEAVGQSGSGTITPIPEYTYATTTIQPDSTYAAAGFQFGTISGSVSAQSDQGNSFFNAGIDTSLGSAGLGFTNDIAYFNTDSPVASVHVSTGASNTQTANSDFIKPASLGDFGKTITTISNNAGVPGLISALNPGSTDSNDTDSVTKEDNVVTQSSVQYETKVTGVVVANDEYLSPGELRDYDNNGVTVWGVSGDYVSFTDFNKSEQWTEPAGYVDNVGSIHWSVTNEATGHTNKYYTEPGAVETDDTYEGNGAFTNSAGCDYSGMEGYGQEGFGEARSEGSSYDSFGNYVGGND